MVRKCAANCRDWLVFCHTVSQMTALDFDLPPPRRLVPWGTFASLGLHGALAVALIMLSPLREMVVPAPDPVSVEIVTPEQFAALQPPQPAPDPPLSVAEPEKPPVTAALPQSTDRLPPIAPLQPELPQNATHTATAFFSRSLLKEPGMARIRRTFGTLADSEKLMQLCNIEGLEQLRRVAPDTDPDTLVPYAMADPMSVGLTLTAPGAAFRSRRKWYGVSFTCAVAPDLQGVTAFAFTLGESIPEDQWEEHNLNVADADE